MIALAAHSVVVYFLQPSLGTMLVAGAFLLSVPLDRPLAGKLAHDFCPLPNEMHANLHVRRFFRQISLLWAFAQTAQAAITIWLLFSQSIGTFVVLRTAVSVVVTVAALVASVVWFKRSMHRNGITVNLPTWRRAAVVGSALMPQRTLQTVDGLDLPARRLLVDGTPRARSGHRARLQRVGRVPECRSARRRVARQRSRRRHLRRTRPRRFTRRVDARRPRTTRCRGRGRTRSGTLRPGRCGWRVDGRDRRAALRHHRPCAGGCGRSVVSGRMALAAQRAGRAGAAAMTRTGFGRRITAKLSGVRVASKWTNPSPPVDLVPELRVPITYIHGTNDRFIPLHDAALLYEHTPEPRSCV